MTRRRRIARSTAAVVSLVAGLLVPVVALPAGVDAAVLPSTGGLYHPVAPFRVLDTQSSGGCIRGGTSRAVAVVGGDRLPRAAASVVLNVTVAAPTAAGYLTAWPSGGARPLASNLNFAVGQRVAGLVTVGVGVEGQVALYVNAGCAHVQVDAVGFHGRGPVASGGFVPVVPVRRLDTRVTGQGPCVSRAAPRPVQVAGVGGVPSGASAVALSVAVVNPAVDGYVTLFPTGAARPVVSTLNHAAGRVVANSTLVPVGSNGTVSVYAYGSCVHVVVDVVGYVSPGAVSAGGFTGVPPSRLLDTRKVAGGCVAATAGRVVDLDSPPSGVALPPGVRSVSLNVTVLGAATPVDVVLHPAGTSAPLVSMVAVARGQVAANQVRVPVAADGRVVVSTTGGCAHVLLDVLGYTTDPPALVQGAPVAGVTVSPTSGVAPLRVSLDARSAFDPEGGPVTVRWWFSDRGPEVPDALAGPPSVWPRRPDAEGPLVSRSFAAGTWEATARVEDADGLVTLVSQTVVVATGPVERSAFLRPFEDLNPGDSVVSPNRQHRLTMLADGNLSLNDELDVYSPPNRFNNWSSGSSGNAGARAVFQGSDGNLVVYAPGGRPVWSANTGGRGADRLAVQDDGNLVIYTAANAVLWQSGSFTRALAPLRAPMRSGQYLQTDTSATYRLYMQSDGNLVLTRRSGPTRTVTWSTNTWGNPGAYAVMLPDGALEVRRSNGTTAFRVASNVPNALLVLEVTGNLVIKDRPGGPVRWQTGTS